MIYFISHNGIQNSTLELTVLSELNKCTDFLYLTAAQNLKAMRNISFVLSSQTHII